MLRITVRCARSARTLPSLTGRNAAVNQIRLISSSAVIQSEAEAQVGPRPFISPKVEEVFNRMTSLDIAEVAMIGELVTEKLGLTITPADIARRAGQAIPAASSADGDNEEKLEEVKEERTAFDLKLTGFDAKAKIKVIKEIRAITSLGLKEAKEMVEGAPKVVKKDIKMEEAEELKKKLEAIGGTVEIV